MLRKNDLKLGKNSTVYQHLEAVQKAYSQVFTNEFMNALGKGCGFIERIRKITPLYFVKTLIYSTLTQDKQSLVDMKPDFIRLNGGDISKVAIHKKFTKQSVLFLRLLLNKLITATLPPIEGIVAKNTFSCICIKDSSKYKIPISYLDEYPGYGSYGKHTALMNLQFEYDLAKGGWQCIELTKATRNDQADTKETAGRIRANGLYIRDLGYITTDYLKGVLSNNAFFLNRLPKIGVYTFQQGQYIPLDWQALDRQMKKAGHSCYEKEVYIGEKERIKCRLVIMPVPKDVTRERIRKAAMGGKRKKGYQLSKEYKIKAHYNIYITNVPCDRLDPQQVIETYRLRWQIELVFKT